MNRFPERHSNITDAPLTKPKEVEGLAECSWSMFTNSMTIAMIKNDLGKLQISWELCSQQGRTAYIKYAVPGRRDGE